MQRLQFIHIHTVIILTIDVIVTHLKMNVQTWVQQQLFWSEVRAK